MGTLYKKSIIFALYFLILAIGGYTGIWFYQAQKIEKLFNEMLYQLDAGLYEKDIKFLYENASITGYPFRFNLQIEQPHYMYSSPESAFEVLSEQHITLRSSLLGGKVAIDLPEDLKMVWKEQGLPLKFQFRQPPKINITISQDSFVPWLLYMAAIDTEQIYASFQEFHYTDAGYTVTNEDSGKVLSSSKKNALHIINREKNPEQKQFELSLTMDDINGDAFYALQGFEKSLGNTQFTTKLLYTGPMKKGQTSANDVLLQFEQINLQSELFTLTMNGQIVLDPRDLFPYGDVSIALTNYKSFVDYHTDLINFMSANTTFPLSNVKPYQRNAAKRFLEDIAISKKEENQHIQLSFTRRMKEDLFIGKKTLPEVMKLYKRRFAKPKPKPVEEPEEEEENE